VLTDRYVVTDVSGSNASIFRVKQSSEFRTVRLLLLPEPPVNTYQVDKTQHFTRHECSLLAHFGPRKNVIF